MGSLGGLDVAYGSNTQIIRTNVLAVATDATTTQAQADIVHEVASAKFPASLRPDYTCFLGADKAVGYATALTGQVENGILKDLSAVPCVGNRMSGTTSGNRMYSIEAILSVGAVELQTDDTADADTLFDETATTGMSVDELTTGASMQSQLMASQFALTAAGGSESAPVAGNAGVQTMSFTELLDDTQWDGLTELATGGITATTASTATVLLNELGGKSFIYSMTCLATVR